MSSPLLTRYRLTSMKRFHRREMTLLILAARKRLDPQLRRFWIVLLEENGRRSAAARRLHIHRNTAPLVDQTNPSHFAKSRGESSRRKTVRF